VNARRGTRYARPAALCALVLLCAATPACPAGEATARAGSSLVESGVGTGKIEACKLISATAAGKILGTTVTVKPVETSAAGSDAASMCSYQTGQVRGGFMLLAGRVKYSDAATEVAARKKEAVSDLPPGIPTPTFTDVHGLGEAAYLEKTPASVELHVLQHGVVVVITFVRKADQTVVRQCEQLARIALGNVAGS